MMDQRYVSDYSHDVLMAHFSVKYCSKRKKYWEHGERKKYKRKRYKRKRYWEHDERKKYWEHDERKRY